MWKPSGIASRDYKLWERPIGCLKGVICNIYSPIARLWICYNHSLGYRKIDYTNHDVCWESMFQCTEIPQAYFDFLSGPFRIWICISTHIGNLKCFSVVRIYNQNSNQVTEVEFSFQS